MHIYVTNLIITYCYTWLKNCSYKSTVNTNNSNSSQNNIQVKIKDIFPFETRLILSDGEN